MSATRPPLTKWLPEHQQDCKGFWLRWRNNAYHVEWKDNVTGSKRSHRVGTTYSEAYEATKQLACRLRIGRPAAPKSATVHAVAEDWFARCLVPPRYKPATIANYKYYVERFILPTLGTHRFDDVDPLLWQEFFSRIDEFDSADPKLKKHQGVTPEQVNTVKKVVKSLCRWAQANDYATANNAASVRMTSVEHAEQATMTPEQFEFFLGFVDEYYRVHFSMLFYGGIRGCELAALPWPGVVFREDELMDIHITQSLSRTTIGAPKTKSSLRVLTEPHFLAEQLSLHRERQAATQTPHPDDLVFTSVTGKRLNLTNLRARVFHPALKAANAKRAEDGLPPLPAMHPHGIRHSTITTLRSMGVSDTAVQRFAGHSSLRMTDHYTHMDDQNREQIAGALDAAHHAAVSTSADEARGTEAQPSEE